MGKSEISSENGESNNNYVKSSVVENLFALSSISLKGSFQFLSEIQLEMLGLPIFQT